ncbi:MAG: hypothetical protein Q4B50_01150 [Bacillota bacterium]|nr:hypothetical protein [Bacillota bacterium]
MLDQKAQLISNFQSIMLFLEPDEAGSDFSLPGESICDWLRRYEQWFDQNCGLSEKKRGLLLYGRNISISGTGLLQRKAALKNLLRKLTEMNQSISLHLNFREIYEDFSFLEEICGESGIGSLGLSVDNKLLSLPEEEMEAFLQKLRGLRRSLILFGSMDELRRLKLFSSPALNSTDLSVSLYPEEDAEAPSVFVRPCANRLLLCIAPDGKLYPCLGLIGFEKFALGSIYDPDEENLLPLEKHPLDLLRLRAEGPCLLHEDVIDSSTTLPWMCKLHRGELLEYDELQ